MRIVLKENVWLKCGEVWEFWGYNGHVYEEYCFLVSDATNRDICRRTLSIFGLEETRLLDVEAVNSSETSVNIYHATWRKIQKENIIQMWTIAQERGVYRLKKRFLFKMLVSWLVFIFIHSKEKFKSD
jgi:hypothetical protein